MVNESSACQRPCSGDTGQQQGALSCTLLLQCLCQQHPCQQHPPSSFQEAALETHALGYKKQKKWGMERMLLCCQGCLPAKSLTVFVTNSRVGLHSKVLAIGCPQQCDSSCVLTLTLVWCHREHPGGWLVWCLTPSVWWHRVGEGAGPGEESGYARPA